MQNKRRHIDLSVEATVGPIALPIALNALRNNHDALRSFFAIIGPADFVALFSTCTALYAWIENGNKHFDIAALALEYFYKYLDGFQAKPGRSVGGGTRAFSLLRHLTVGRSPIDRRLVEFADRAVAGDRIWGCSGHINHCLPGLYVSTIDLAGLLYVDLGQDAEQIVVRCSTPFFTGFCVSAVRRKDLTTGFDFFYALVWDASDIRNLFAVKIDVQVLSTETDYHFDLAESPKNQPDWATVRKWALPEDCTVDFDCDIWHGGNFFALRIACDQLLTGNIDDGSTLTILTGGTVRMHSRVDRSRRSTDPDCRCYVNDMCYVYNDQFLQPPGAKRRLRRKVLLPFRANDVLLA